MNITYCPDCGKKHEYNFAKPNFCSGCGSPFGVAKLKKIGKTSKREEEYEDEDEDFEDDDDDSFSNATRVPNIRKIQVDIERDEEYNTFDLGSIIGGTSSASSRAPSPKRRSSSVSIEDFKQNKR
jgi:hypothetical protein